VLIDPDEIEELVVTRSATRRSSARAFRENARERC
jgi:hypothetical protein